MKYTINHNQSGEEELILNYVNLSGEVEKIIQFMNGQKTRLIGKIDDQIVTINPKTIIYIESVDEKTFAYTENTVIKLDLSLTRLEMILEDVNYFRCSKSIIMNINKVLSLKSLPSNRIDAVMQGNYHIIISRKYASEFRRILKGE